MVWSDCHLSSQSSGGHGVVCHLLSQSSGGHGVVWLTSWVNPAEGVDDRFHHPLSRWRLRLHCLQGWWSHVAWQWSPTIHDWSLVTEPSVHILLWDLAVCSFLEWEAWSLSLAGAATSMIFVATKHIFCRDKSTLVATKLLSRQKSYLWQLPPMIDLRLHFARWPFSTVLSEVFGQQVSHRDAEINLGTFPTSGFVWAVSTGILAVLSPLLDPPKTCHVPVCFPLCLSRLRGVGCRYFWRHWCMFCPDPLSVWFTLVGGLAWTSWSRWVCP